MSLSIDSNQQFGTLFSALPWEIKEHIFQYLSTDFISIVLLKAPSLRPFIIDKYYSEICLFLTVPNPIYENIIGAFNTPYTPPVTHFSDIEKIKKFFRENPDIVPRKFKIYPNIKYGGFEEVLRSCQGALTKAQKLEIKFSLIHYRYWENRLYFSRKLMDLIFSFGNLSLLDVWYEKGYFHSLPASKSLEHLALSTDGNLDWSRVSLPPNLRELCISIQPNTKFPSSIDFPVYPSTDIEPDSDNWGNKTTFEKLFGLLWNAPFTIKPTADQARCPNLAMLKLNYCGLDCLPLSLLPPTLTFLEVSYNRRMDSIEYSGPGPYWPKNLQSLVLDDNSIDDYMLSKLSKIGWPIRLTKLSLNSNQIKSLKHLFNLPKTLAELSLDCNRMLKDLNFTRDDNGYRISNLPDSLGALDLDECTNLRWGHFGNSEELPIQERLHFPPKLKFLRMNHSNLKTLANFVFPPSLKWLNVGDLPHNTPFS